MADVSTRWWPPASPGPAGSPVTAVGAARAAALAGDWRRAHELFGDAEAALAGDDLAAFAVAAWVLGRGADATRLGERAYLRQLRGEPSVAAVTAAGNGMRWSVRGHAAVARQWADRARLLLRVPAGRSDAAGRGHLAYLDAAIALDTGDDAAVVAADRDLHDALRHAGAAGDSARPLVAVFAAVRSALVDLRSGRAERGADALDAVLLPTLDDRIGPEWAADVYRRVLGAGPGVVAEARTRAWLESMQRWSARVAGPGGAPRATYLLYRARMVGDGRAADLIRWLGEVADVDAGAAAIARASLTGR